jgi:hypothetical protein
MAGVVNLLRLFLGMSQLAEERVAVGRGCFAKVWVPIGRWLFRRPSLIFVWSFFSHIFRLLGLSGRFSSRFPKLTGSSHSMWTVSAGADKESDLSKMVRCVFDDIF